MCSEIQVQLSWVLYHTQGHSQGSGWDVLGRATDVSGLPSLLTWLLAICRSLCPHSSVTVGLSLPSVPCQVDFSTGQPTAWQFARLNKWRGKGSNMEATGFCNLVSEVTFHHFCHIFTYQKPDNGSRYTKDYARIGTPGSRICQLPFWEPTTTFTK